MTFWTAGFDIIYSCQDYEFDRRGTLQPAQAPRNRRGALGITSIPCGMLACLLALVKPLHLGR